MHLGTSPLDLGTPPWIWGHPPDLGTHVLTGVSSLPPSCFVLGDERGQPGSDLLIFH